MGGNPKPYHPHHGRTIFDFLLQTGYQANNKGIYGHPGGIFHVVGHFLGSIPVLFFAGTPLSLALMLLVGELFFHYHVDWLKSKITNAYGWGPGNHAFWIAFGVDQALHQATYLVMVALMIGMS